MRGGRGERGSLQLARSSSSPPLLSVSCCCLRPALSYFRPSSSTFVRGRRLFMCPKAFLCDADRRSFRPYLFLRPNPSIRRYLFMSLHYTSKLAANILASQVPERAFESGLEIVSAQPRRGRIAGPRDHSRRAEAAECLEPEAVELLRRKDAAVAAWRPRKRLDRHPRWMHISGRVRRLSGVPRSSAAKRRAMSGPGVSTGERDINSRHARARADGKVNSSSPGFVPKWIDARSETVRRRRQHCSRQRRGVECSSTPQEDVAARYDR